MALDPVQVGVWRDPDIARIGNAHGTRPVLVSKAGAVGTRFHAASASLSVATANTLRLLIGRLMPFVTAPGAMNYATGSITRTTGSFVEDGWKVGDRLISTGSTTLANDTETIVTGVAATTLTVTAASFTAEAFPAGALLYRAGYPVVFAMPASAGQAVDNPAVDLMASAKWPSLDAAPDRAIILGPKGALFAAVGTAIAAGAANWLDVIVLGGDY